MTWLRVWARAVIVPAARRVAPVWAACGLIGGQLFGGAAMRPRDLTGLALARPALLATLTATWLLVFLPTARVLVRQDGARWLRSLPGPVVTPVLVAAAALVGLQAPWVALWLVGAGCRGAVVVGAQTLIVAAIAAWRPRPRSPRIPTWAGASTALFGVHARALSRRAADTLVRGAGLAVIAGLAGGLFIANNQLVGRDAAIVGGAVIAIVLVPAVTGPLLVLLESHRATRWPCLSMGITEATRHGALAAWVVALYLVGTVVALVAATVIAGFGGWLVVVALALAVGCGLAVTRILVGTGEGTRVAARAAIGAFAVACAAIVTLGTVGVGGLALVLVGGLASVLVIR